MLQPTPQYTSPQVDTNHEGSPKRVPGQHKQWPETVWGRHYGKLRRVAVNKLNYEVYALTFGPHHMPAQENNQSKNSKRFYYK